ncbi:MAG: hypothetical protein U9R57_16395 [Thermodesulfobacteriota bacterium]|nr:hypothetical protein [Thermodesulfobacteriota bacterium]
MQTINDTLDFLFYRIFSPLVLSVRNLFDLLFLDSLSALHIPPTGQVVIVAVCTVLFAFSLRWWLKVDAKEKVFRKAFVAQKTERDQIGIVDDKKSRDEMYKSADQTIDEGFNTYLAQHYFRYVSIYLLPLFLVMSWLNHSLDKNVLTVVSGHAYLFLLPSHPLGMEGVSVTMLYLLVYVMGLIIGFQVKRRLFSKAQP